MTKDKKIILVTGSSSEIGYEVVRVLASNQDNVVYATALQIVELERLAVVENVITQKMDITNEEEIDDVIQKILTKEKRVDVLIHAENISSICPVEKVTVDEAKKIMNTNVIGFTYIVSKLLPTMKKNVEGHIVAVSSVAGVVGIPFKSLYSASKFALEGYCESLHEELTDFYIRVSLVECGPVSSDRLDDAREEESEDEEEENKMLETFTQKTDAFRQTMSQTAESVAKQICTVIETPNEGQLRYETNTIFTNALCNVFKEKTTF